MCTYTHVLIYTHVCTCTHTYTGLEMDGETKIASKHKGFFIKFKIDYINIYVLFSHYTMYRHDLFNDLCSPNG